MISGDSNTYAYVEGNPVSFIDSLGLWSVTAGAYGGPVPIGPGIQITFGSNQGSSFITARFGVGKGGGIAWNLNGNFPALPQESVRQTEQSFLAQLKRALILGLLVHIMKKV